jgi:TRAP-type C4-dicarboxylate transport system substrate-binding protein
MKQRQVPLVVAVIAVLATAGCIASGIDKSGDRLTPTVLVMANNDRGLAGAPAVAHFVNRVTALSDGRLQIHVQSEWKGRDDEPRLIKDVAAGGADLGWSGTRAFDVVGDNAFEALQAPFLIRSYAAEGAVVTNPVGEDMLQRLAPSGLTGLAVTAGELRIPAAAGGPLLAPTDFTGLRFHSVNSVIQAEALRALGAQPDTGPLPEDMSEFDAAETMWQTYQARAQYEYLPFLTGNAPLWPRTMVIFANTKRLTTLDARSRGWLTKAAAESTQWSAAHAADGVKAEMTRACSFGARIAATTPDQLIALRRAVEPVYARLRARPGAAELLIRVQRIVDATGPVEPVSVPPACAYRPGDESRKSIHVPALSAPGRAGALPAATYRVSFTTADLTRHGLTSDGAAQNAGVWTWTLGGGSWSWVLKAVDANAEIVSCEGWYDVRGSRAIFTTTSRYAFGDCAPPTWSARWKVDNDRLQWTDENVADFAYLFAGRPWQRIS